MDLGLDDSGDDSDDDDQDVMRFSDNEDGVEVIEDFEFSRPSIKTTEPDEKEEEELRQKETRAARRKKERDETRDRVAERTKRVAETAFGRDQTIRARFEKISHAKAGHGSRRQRPPEAKIKQTSALDVLSSCAKPFKTRAGPRQLVHAREERLGRGKSSFRQREEEEEEEVKPRCC